MKLSEDQKAGIIITAGLILSIFKNTVTEFLPKAAKIGSSEVELLGAIILVVGIAYLLTGVEEL